MYHYVRPYNSEFPYFKNLDIEDFRKQLDYFEQNYGFVDKQHFIKSFETGEIPKGVVLTFDDGLKCHYDYVYRELSKRGLWGIFYVATQPFIEGTFIDVHRVHVLLGRISAKEIYEHLMSLVIDEMLDKSREDEFNALSYPNQQNNNYTLLVKRMINYFITYDFREQVINLLIEHFVPGVKTIFDNYYVSPEEIKEMNEGGMIIGSHTVNHPLMSRLSKEDQTHQIINSFNYLESLTGVNSNDRTFCYPHGGFHSFSDTTESILTQEGCLYSFNVEQRDIEKNDVLNRPQALPRYDCNQFEYGQVRSVEN
jgi:peptidoglycan/xylan/chitin deacetylase (PgdA/CDA1 family)